MSTLSQSIPNLLSGISQQPDNRKRPGQVKDAVNTFPDFALGMLKRPGGKFVSKLHGASASGKWFEILRDANEKYIAQYADNVFRVWDLDGDTRMVNMGTNTGVPGTCNTVTVKAASDDLNAKRAATAVQLTHLQVTETALAEAIAGQNETISISFDTDFTYTNDVEESVRTGIILGSDGVYLVKSNNTVISNATTLPAGYAAGTERTNEHPLAASKGYKIFEINLTVAATHTPTDLTNATTAYNTAKTNYDTAVTAEGVSEGAYDTAVANCAITSIPSNGYLNGATVDDIELLTLNDSTFVLNKAKQVALKADLTHAGTLDPYRAQVTITVVSNNTDYIIALDGTDYTYTSHSSSATADAIAIGLTGAINGVNGFTAIAIGSGIYITKASFFSIHVSAAGVSAETMFVITDSTSNTSQLPLESKNGYVLKIVNSLDIDIDDMYLKFETDNGAGTGRGQWFETTAPDIKYKFDELTMPHRLVSQADGTFTFEAITWDERIVGDDNTNPVPSFVDGYIDHIFFYRNRLGFLSGQNVVLSKAADLFDFWNTTAQTATDDDPIDISVAGKKPVFLHYVQPTSVGLVLYSSVEQFLLTTDSDILSPKTAKVNTMSNYECDPSIEAVSLGISQAFISKTPLFTRLFELTDIATDTPPLMSDITNYVPELIPQSIDTLKASPGLSLVSLGTVGNSTLYQYRFLNRSREERAVNSWYKWELTGTLLTQFFDNSTFYAVVANGTDVYVQSYDVTQANEQGYLSLPTGEKTDVCLDLFNINPHRTFHSKGIKKFDTFATTAAFPVSDDSVGIDIVLSDPSDPGSGVTGTAATDSSGNITSITITNPGKNYNIGDAVSITETAGSGVATAVIDDAVDITAVFLPYDAVSGKTLNLLVLGEFGSILTPTITGAPGSRYVAVNGDYRGKNLIIGYGYDMTIDLPKLFRYSINNNNIENDDVSSLIIHRMKFKLGLSGPVDYKVSITGIDPFTKDVTVTLPQQYTLNNVNMQASSTHVVPIFQRNENLAVQIIGNTPFPVSLLGLDWEGKLNQRFYRRG